MCENTLGNIFLSDHLGMLTFDLKKDVTAAELGPHVNNIRKMMDTKKKKGGKAKS